MVGDPFQVGEQVRGQHDGQAAGRHRLDQLGQEVPAGQRVEGGDRLVEQQQPGPFGQGKRQRQLRLVR